MRLTLFLANVACFASFGWGMLRHFGRGGKPRAGMMAAAAMGPVFAGIHLAAIATRPLARPGMALVLYVGGAGLFWWAVRATRGCGLGACFQGIVPAVVVRAGPYRWMRHPFYTSYMLVWVAGWVATGWGLLGGIAGIMACVYGAAARGEREQVRNVRNLPHE